MPRDAAILQSQGLVNEEGGREEADEIERRILKNERLYNGDETVGHA